MRAGILIALLALVGTLLAVRAGLAPSAPPASRSDPASEETPRVNLPNHPREVAVAHFLAGWAGPEGTETDRVTGYPRRIRRATDGMVMVLVPAGTFQMGAVPEDDAALPNERPRHSVTLTRAYYLDECEVTIGMWRAHAQREDLKMPWLHPDLTDEHPVGWVSWYDARKYAERVGATLPTEAQWERAARAGHEDWIYSWGVLDDAEMRNGARLLIGGNLLSLDGFGWLAPVKSFPPNDFGLYDLIGNVTEWCLDAYDEAYYGAGAPVVDPRGPPAAEGSVGAYHRVVRSGGHGGLDASSLRCSYRGFTRPVLDVGGFRCAKSLP